ncbi:hypothetical protein Tco_0281676 [Tanacetum coccineum]
MNKNRTANRNPVNYHLYHALMEALIADEDAMDKEVKDRVKDHKRKHDSDYDETMMMMKDLQLIKPGKMKDHTPEPNGPFPPMISSRARRTTWQMHTPQRIKFPRRTSFKGGRMIYVSSSNGSADEHEMRSSAKLIWKVQLSTFTIRAWRLGNDQRMTRGGAKTSSQRSRKDYRSRGSLEVWKALLEEE